MLDSEYPKLVRLCGELWRRIHSLGGAGTVTTTSIDQPGTPASDVDNISSLLTADNTTLLLSLDDNDYESVSVSQSAAVSVCVCLHSYSCEVKFVLERGVARLWEVATFSLLLCHN